MEDSRMSFTASVQQSTALIAKKTKAGMEVWIPTMSRNCREKMVGVLDLYRKGAGSPSGAQLWDAISAADLAALMFLGVRTDPGDREWLDQPVQGHAARARQLKTPTGAAGYLHRRFDCAGKGRPSQYRRSRPPAWHAGLCRPRPGDVVGCHVTRAIWGLYAGHLEAGSV
jgi:hypothetical protein